MKCIEVLLNGEVVCRAGHEHMSLLTATLHVLNDPEFTRFILSGRLEPEANFAQLPRWLDMSILQNAEITLRVVDAESADEPARVSSFGQLPGNEMKKFCSFCGKAAENGPPMMLGVSGIICAPCVLSFTKWANEKTTS